MKHEELAAARNHPRRRLRSRFTSAQRLLAVLVGPLLMGLALIPGTVAADHITIAGTGAGLGTMRLLGAEFARRVRTHAVQILPNLGSAGGLKALEGGAVDLAVISRPLTAAEMAQGLIASPYGRTPFVVVASKAGGGTIGSVQELAEIYEGRRTDWPSGTPIRIILRPASDGDTQLLESFSPAMKQAAQKAAARAGMMIASTDQDAADALEKTPGAIGVASLSLLLSEKRQLNIMSMGGVSPNVATLANGTYPYFKTMYLVHKRSTKDAALRFLEFVASAQGKEILLNSGYWVANFAEQSGK